MGCGYIVDGADGGQVGVLELLHQLACAGIHDVHRMQGYAAKVLADVPVFELQFPSSLMLTCYEAYPHHHGHVGAV